MTKPKGQQAAETRLLPTSKIQTNNGQIPGLPKNPRLIRDERFAKLSLPAFSFELFEGKFNSSGNWSFPCFPSIDGHFRNVESFCNFGLRQTHPFSPFLKFLTVHTISILNVHPHVQT